MKTAFVGWAAAVRDDATRFSRRSDVDRYAKMTISEPAATHSGSRRRRAAGFSRLNGPRGALSSTAPLMSRSLVLVVSPNNGFNKDTIGERKGGARFSQRLEYVTVKFHF